MSDIPESALEAARKILKDVDEFVVRTDLGMEMIAADIARALMAERKKALEEAAEAQKYATDLAASLCRKHWPENIGWKPLPDLYGVISQIDNMTTGIADKAYRKALEEAAKVAEYYRDVAIGHALVEAPDACQGIAEDLREMAEAAAIRKLGEGPSG